MDALTIGIIGVIVFLLVVLFLRMPIGFAMIIVGFWGIFFLRSPASALDQIASTFVTSFSNYTLTAVAQFVFLGYIAYYSGLGGNLFKFADAIVGHIRGGKAMAVQVACALFGAICGSFPATIGTMGAIALPELKKSNYDVPLSAASIAAGSSLGSLIPPSLPLMIYGIATETSIGKLFAAGVFPGILHMSAYMVCVAILVKLKPSLAPVGPRPRLRNIVDKFTDGVIEVLLVFLVSIGGLFMGWFTPTEAGGVGAVALLAITLIKKRMNLEKISKSLLDTVKLTGMIYILLVGANIFGRFVTYSNVAHAIGQFVRGLDFHPYIIMIIIILIYLALGTIIDTLPLMLITIPIFYPIVVGDLGFSSLWYGVLLVFAMSMGSMTPPIGFNVFVMKGILPDVPIEKLFKAMIPFVITDFTVSMIIMVFPSIVTFLPDLLF